MNVPALSRGSYLFAALGFTALVIYGSLVPLHYEPLPWSEATARFQEIPYLALGLAHRADWVSNILLFIPLAYLWTGMLTLGRPSRGRRWLTGALVVIVAAAMSVALEFTQSLVSTADGVAERHPRRDAGRRCGTSAVAGDRTGHRRVDRPV